VSDSLVMLSVCLTCTLAVDTLTERLTMIQLEMEAICYHGAFHPTRRCPSPSPHDLKLLLLIQLLLFEHNPAEHQANMNIDDNSTYPW
jgi:hypothetical protein